MFKFHSVLMLLFAVLFSFTSCHQEAGLPQARVSNSPHVVEPLRSATQARVGNGSFSALTYNVAGLPQGISSSNPAANSALIGQRLRSFDIVNMQEDFNYHATIYDNDNHVYRTSTSGGVPFGDGLNTLSKYAFTDFQRVKWNKCNGTDCLTPKGFSFMRIQLAEGVYVDFYNAHPNAGTADADLTARRANITQLSQFIQQYSSGNAVIVMADFNCRYTRTGDNIRELINNNGLTDVWIEKVRNGVYPALGADPLLCEFPNMVNSCEVVDKIFYRDSKLIDLTPGGYKLDDPAFVTTSGQPLSDHYPLLTQFSWSLNAGWLASDLFGGPHGTPFNDLAQLTTGAAPRSFTIRGGARIDQVGITLANGTYIGHGGSGGTAQTLTLNAGEYIQQVKICSGQKSGRTRIFYAELRTSQNRVLSAGTLTSDVVTYTAPAGYRVVGFYGNSGDEVDKLGLIYGSL